jgi:DNA modification methylase
MTIRVLHGDCRDVLPTLAAESVQCCVTSPPYYGLRDYGTASWEGGDPGCDHRKVQDAISAIATSTLDGGKKTTGHLQEGYRGWCARCGARRVDQQIGLEQSPDAYVAELVSVFREVRRVLRPDGLVFLNLGDSYAGSWGARGRGDHTNAPRPDLEAKYGTGAPTRNGLPELGIKPKDLLGIPWMVAFALRADGWWLRKDIIWCLSGGTRVYARTQKGEMPMTIKDMVRLDPSTVQLWNGEKWTQVLGWNETPRPATSYEIELRNGQRIGCTANHEWPTLHGNVRADDLRVGDIIRHCKLPQPELPRHPSALDDETIGWFVGLYIAEGSRSGGTIQIASHSNEEERFIRLANLAEAFDGYSAVHKTSENGCTVSINGPMIGGLIDTYVSGDLASGKHLHPRCWRRSNAFLRAVLDGYLSGDGHWDEHNQRWRLGFCDNDELVADLRTIGARLGVSVRLRRHQHQFAGREFPGYRGEVRFARSDHWNSRDDGEIVAIRESRARKFWDIGVADEPHLFALASGILTHNSKPNPMPESVTDRPTSSHEHVFMLAKSERYFWDGDAVKEENSPTGKPFGHKRNVAAKTDTSRRDAHSIHAAGLDPAAYWGFGRNIRDVWTIATQPFKHSHFATMAPELAARCIKAGTSERGCCSRCGAPWERQSGREVQPQAFPDAKYDRSDPRFATKRNMGARYQAELNANPKVTTGWAPSCSCGAPAVPCTVLDPFGGAGTTGLVADRLGRNAVLIELNPAYGGMARERIIDDSPLFAEVVA